VFDTTFAACPWSHWPLISIPWPASWGARINHVVSTIRNEVGNEAFAELGEQGQSMNVQEAVAYALDDKAQA
jgi:hypothetical protein